MLVCIDQPTHWCHIPQGHSLNIHFSTDLKSWTFTALMTYLIHNAFILRCHTFIVDIKQMQHASVPNRRKRINRQLQHILFSLSKGLATCFRLNQSVMRPLYETNSRYNKINVNIWYMGSHIKITITVKILTVKDVVSHKRAQRKYYMLTCPYIIPAICLV
jgi:hypothetical protein